MKRVSLHVLVVAMSMALLGTTLVAPQADARGRGKAGVVVVHGDGRVVTECVRLDRATISGLQLLERTGIPFSAARFGFGTAICRLDGEGPDTTDSSDCFSDPQDRFWGYWTQDKGDAGPVSSEFGAGDRRVRRRSIDYWVWDALPSEAPATLTFAQVCGAAA